MKKLIIRGARQNNLKNISLDLPHDKLIVITGLSGSGKSSLAFDTLYAEGQWRFLESLSTYARMYIEKLDRPDVDSIKNIRPSIALEQKNPVKGSRSTVGTLTEIYDLYRVLYSRVSTPFCPVCGKEIVDWTVDKIVLNLLEKHYSEKAALVFSTNLPPEELLKGGFHRYWDGKGFVEIERNTKGPIEVVVDRVIIKDRKRLADSVEIAYKWGKKRMSVLLFLEERIERINFSSGNVCDYCGKELPEPSVLLFSFNHPIGACPECKGFGNILVYDEALIVPDPTLSIREGAIEPWEKPAASWWKEQLLSGAKRAGIDVDKPFSELTPEEKDKIFSGTTEFYGIDDFFEELEYKKYKLHVRVFLSRYRTPETCPSCGGKRLKPEALAYKVGCLDIAELSSLSVEDTRRFFRNLKLKRQDRMIAKEVLRQIDMKLEFLSRVGLNYLTLDRLGKTLSGGEYQRVNLSNQIGSKLTGTLYVLDEPTIGLHPRDTNRIINVIKEMVGLGNTAIVVEHDASVIRAAHWVVELGPLAGYRGGSIVFSGPMEEFEKRDTITSRYIRGVDLHLLDELKENKKSEFKEKLVIKGARGNNLNNITVEIPLGAFTVVTGVSGSGKSSLVVETLYRALARRFRLSGERPLPYDDIVGAEKLRGLKLVDQSPIGKTPRSNPVTYLKVFDHIRRVFASVPYARMKGYTPGFFSFNIKGGRCEVCKGEGFVKLEMFFFEDLYVKCEECKGKRYNKEALSVLYRGKNIHDVLEMTVDEAIEFFKEEPSVVEKLQILSDIALGYLKLGQPATTLSGGEAQRIKIAAEMTLGRSRGVLYILDEPTVGLHYRDVIHLIRILKRLVKEGNTVLVIEHNTDLIGTADWIIDLGPEGGPHGGKVVYQGPLSGIKGCKSSITARFL